MSQTSPAIAGPDATVNDLMSEPLSLLDWGIWRTAEYLDGKEGRPGAWAEYDFDSNTIQIQSYALYEDANEAEVSGYKELCADWIAKVRTASGVNSDTGEPHGKYTFFSGFFRHQGYIRGEQSESDERLKDLDKKFRVRFEIRTDYWTAVVRCEAPLLGKGFAVETMWKG